MPGGSAKPMGARPPARSREAAAPLALRPLRGVAETLSCRTETFILRFASLSLMSLSLLRSATATAHATVQRAAASVPPCGAYASVNGTKSRPSIIAFIASVSFAYLCRARQASASCQRGVAPTRGTNTHACDHGPIPAHTHALGVCRCFAGLSPTSADRCAHAEWRSTSAYFLERRLMETTSSLHRMSRQRSAVSITCLPCVHTVATSC